jgi:hypothetical protein
MISLYAYNPQRVALEATPDVVRWKNISKIINDNISFIDRTGFIKLPINTSAPAESALPVFDNTFSLSYTECCQLQVRRILQQQERLDKPIRLMYSGGIDSSMVLLSFINELGVERLSTRLEIVMSSVSIDENPAMWEKVLRRSDIKLINSLEFNSGVSNDYILVGGEFNDQLFGSAMIKTLLKWKTAKELLAPRSLSMLVEYFTWAGLEQVEAERWANLLHGLANNAKCEIYSTWDVFWWLNFTCKWTSVYFRFLIFSPQQQINAQYLADNYIQFFGSAEFQQWSMNDKDHKHHGTWNSYKWYPRQLISNFLGDSSYLEKAKRGSLYHVVRGRKSNDAIDSNYNFVNLSTVDQRLIYNPNNSFTGAT